MKSLARIWNKPLGRYFWWLPGETFCLLGAGYPKNVCRRLFSLQHRWTCGLPITEHLHSLHHGLILSGCCINWTMDWILWTCDLVSTFTGLLLLRVHEINVVPDICGFHEKYTRSVPFSFLIVNCAAPLLDVALSNQFQSSCDLNAIYDFLNSLGFFSLFRG